MKLSSAQIKALLSATKEHDFMLHVKGRLKQALIDRELVKDSQGFGYKYGGIQELTPRGLIERERFLKEKEAKP